MRAQDVQYNVDVAPSTANQSATSCTFVYTCLPLVHLLPPPCKVLILTISVFIKAGICVDLQKVRVSVMERLLKRSLEPPRKYRGTLRSSAWSTPTSIPPFCSLSKGWSTLAPTISDTLRSSTSMPSVRIDLRVTMMSVVVNKTGETKKHKKIAVEQPARSLSKFPSKPLATRPDPPTSSLRPRTTARQW